MFCLKKSDVEDLITLTSSRGVARTGVSLKEKNVALYRFDDLKPVSVRFNPFSSNSRVEPWRKRFDSDFQQLAGRIGCLGESPPDIITTRCAILARASRCNESNSKTDDGIVTWLDCITLFEKIPSIKISKNIVFCSYNSKISIKDDVVYKENELYRDRFIEINKDELVIEMLKHVNLIGSEERQSKTSEEDVIKLGENLVLSTLNRLLKKMNEDFLIKPDQIQVNIIWSTNHNHFLSGLSFQPLIKKLEDIKTSFEEQVLLPELYKSYLFSTWLSDDHPNRLPIIGISVERTCYQTNKKELESYLTASQIKKLIERVKERVKTKKFSEIP